ncbi:hypothetical protein BLA29_009628 [Euroglyphus maynei]|uniref:Uncharacterized protein n=1 Tax=Euroglyphus maynei TaxID=6958 RepID=A0A1Y3B5S6_EURMA|nr:hypothetical protein BLA29_009628 [Euroglyphus maynei]
MLLVVSLRFRLMNLISMRKLIPFAI